MDQGASEVFGIVDIVAEILNQIDDFRGVVRLGLVSSLWRSAADGEELWRRHLRRLFPHRWSRTELHADLGMRSFLAHY